MVVAHLNHVVWRRVKEDADLTAMEHAGQGAQGHIIHLMVCHTGILGHVD